MTGSTPSNTKIKVLLADFSSTDDGLHRFLKTHPDFDLLGCVQSGQDVVNSVRQLAPDVVIVRVGEAVFEGVETCFRIRMHQPEVKVVMVAPRLSPSNLMLALEARVHGYVVAEAGHRAVARAVHTVPLGGVYLSGAAADTLVADYIERNDPSRRAKQTKRLSKREGQVLQRLVAGESSVNIARDLELSPKTVDTYCRRLMQKLGVTSRRALVKLAIAQELTVS